MSVAFEDLEVLKTAESVADEIWKHVMAWGSFARDTVGKQLTHAADSTGANIAEAFGRFHYGDKLKCLYYARGSLFETKYWLNRTLVRGLLPKNIVQDYGSQLSSLAHQLNTLAKITKKQRAKAVEPTTYLRETATLYEAPYDVLLETFLSDDSQDLFTAKDIHSLEVLPDT